MSFKYYDEHADKFFNDTVHVNMNEFYEAFLPLVKKEGRILDIGCGSGRDIKAFLDRGFDVVGFDASYEMVKKASSFDEFIVATILADIFDPSGSDDIDLVAKNIVDGLDAYGMIKGPEFVNEDDVAA